jgi:hypothetical protein
MTSMELRSELKHLIDTTDDLSILEWIKSVLASTPLSKEMAEDMLRVARLSDEDIAAGRTYTVDEVKRWMDEQKRKA